MDTTWRITGSWFWASRIGAYRKECCRGLWNAAASDTKGPSRGGKNWRHSPPRSTGAVFRLLFAMSSTFRFTFAKYSYSRRLVPPGNTALPSGLFATSPQGILLVREDRRATVPTCTVTSGCARRPLPGFGRPLRGSTTAGSPATAVFTTTCQSTATSCPAAPYPATQPDSFSVKRSDWASQEARQWPRGSSIDLSPYLASGAGSYPG